MTFSDPRLPFGFDPASRRSNKGMDLMELVALIYFYLLFCSVFSLLELKPRPFSVHTTLEEFQNATTILCLRKTQSGK